jgi:hypothetical protein
VPNEASARGTLQHEAHDTGDDSKLTDEELEQVEKCRAYVRSIEALFVKPARLQEVRLEVDDIDTSAGFLDLFVYESDPEAPLYGKGVLIDFKFGKHPIVPAENNLQGFAYTLGVKRALPFIKEVAIRFLLPTQDTVEACDVILADDGMHEVRWTDASGMPQSRREHWLLRIQSVVAAVNNPASPPVPRALTCMFCMHKQRATCPALLSMALRVAEKYAPLQIPDLVNPSLIGTAAPADIAKGLAFATVMEGWSKGYRSEVTKRAATEEGFDVPGYKIVLTERRTVIDPVAFVKVATEIGQLTSDEILSATDISIGAIEKLVKAKAPRGQKKSFSEKLGAALAEAKATKLSAPIPSLRAVHLTDDENS